MVGKAAGVHRAAHTTFVLRKQRYMSGTQLPSFFSFISEALVHGMVPCISEWVFLLINPVCKLPHSQAQMFVSMMILDPVKLTISIDHHTSFPFQLDNQKYHFKHFNLYLMFMTAGL